MQIITKYFTGLTENQLYQFNELNSLYNKWNDLINLISRKDIKFLYERHILHSLSIGKIINFTAKSKILDVGTGGGFPGIPLAILFPNVKFHLIDSIGKKINVVNDIIEKLKLQNATAEQIRAENHNKKYDFVVSRAVTNMYDFSKIVTKNISNQHNNHIRNGILYLKGGDINKELLNLKCKTKKYYLSDIFDEDFFSSKYIVYLYYN